MTQTQFLQEPTAVIGFACRLPGGNTSPSKLWDFLERGGIASNTVPDSRFNINAHYDGSHKPRTMRPLGGMFLEDIDPADFDASFFENSKVEAISMDPNQRQMLEVVYEALENAGVTLETLNGAPVACFVGSYASDYADMQGRDPEDKPANITVGAGRAILANRLSHFLNIKGPSLTIDTACSGSLVGVDVACRYIQSGEIDAAIIATSNLYLNPEHVMDTGAVGQAHSPTGICHTFDVSADGYVKAEAVSAIMIKRLGDAIKDGDPIRAVIRGSATNSDGRTPGIASPSAEAQATAIRAAYANAGITNFNDTTYLECHGTGTPAGDPTEVGGAGSVFSETRSSDKPLIIGSIKSNVGHAEPAAGISGLMKAIMAIEKGVIPGNPTFENPSPKIDFAGWKVKATRTAIPWPECSIRRASVNSFGYGGSNLHIVIEQANIPREPQHISSYVDEDDGFLSEEDESDRPYTIVMSANDASTLRNNIKALSNHLINPRVKVDLRDLAYTLSEKRTQLYHRAYAVTKRAELDENMFNTGKKSTETPRIGFVFTGQGAQWPQMGKELIKNFPETLKVLKELDQVLQSLSSPPQWSLIEELIEPRSAEHLRQPEFSQPLVTALQICILSIFEQWNIKPHRVIGHSSGEIAAAYTAGYLSKADAIKAAFYRGRAAVNCKDKVASDVGMLAVGLDTDAILPYLKRHADKAWIACFNSPSSLTVSGKRAALEALEADIKADGGFARLLQVDLAYHSTLMDIIADEYEDLLNETFDPLSGLDGVSMFSSVTGSKMTGICDAAYWRANMVSPVRFSEALSKLLSEKDGANFLIEIGPSGALAGPITQIKKSLSNSGTDAQYCASWARGAEAANAMFSVAGRLFVSGSPVSMALVNKYVSTGHVIKPKTIIDLPNYTWNHTVKYWHENQASKDWRFKKYVHHDLLGSKVLGSSWKAPTFRKMLNIADVPWLKDHKMGSDILMPGSGFITMALEAMYQKSQALNPDEGVKLSSDLCYRFRNVRFEKALVIEEGKEAAVLLSLTKKTGSNDWHEFIISSSIGDIVTEHCIGLVRLEDPIEDNLCEADSTPLRYPSSGQLWYKSQSEVGYGFGPDFQRLLKVESISGKRQCRSSVSLKEPKSKWDPQSYYPIHPAALDGCFQTVTPSLWKGERSSMKAVLVPSIIDDVVINKVKSVLVEGFSLADTEYTGRGRPEEAKSYLSNCSVYDPDNGRLLMRMRGLRYIELDTGIQVDPHIFDRISWKPDISFLTQDQADFLSWTDTSSKLDHIVDLIAHKTPALKVLEINLDPADSSCIWFSAGDPSCRAAYTKYSFASSEARTLVGVQTEYESKRNSSFHIANIFKDGFGISDSTYDLIIVKFTNELRNNVGIVVQRLKSLISRNGFMFFINALHLPIAISEVNDDSPAASSPDDRSVVGDESSVSSTSDIPEHQKLSEEKINGLGSSDIKGSDVAQVYDLGRAEPLAWETGKVDRVLAHHGLDIVLQLPTDTHDFSYLCAPLSDKLETNSPRELCVTRLDQNTPALNASLRAVLEASGWSISEQEYPFHKLKSNTTVLILDELSSPILTKINATQWDILKELISSGNNLLWVTQGAQHEVSNPNTALAHGLFRVIRMEDANAKITTLDVQSSTSPATALAIDTVLKSLAEDRPKQFVETEFAERNDIIHVHRVVPDEPVNDFKKIEKEGAEPVVKPLHSTSATVSLRAERLGTFQGLTWWETATSDIAVEANKIEVETVAIGVNFKDVAVTMGIVPENEHKLGYEASGIIKRLGSGVTKFKIGDRVCFLNDGSYANRLQVTAERAHVIPDTMSFEDAATIPSVYLASIYSLFDIANIKKGQSVLIHSASGGVGISAIQLAQYMEADVGPGLPTSKINADLEQIFVTVGTDEKRKFLADNYGILPNRIFSSRNTRFAKEILRATNGRGVDVILNSLTGEMLDESWRICADGGTMVEIGKKDIVDRSMLSMEPFDRNCSFRAMDFSYKKNISDPLIERLLGQIFELVNAGHVKPIHPITTFGFDDITSALAFIRSGRHIGKVVISNGHKSNVQVPIRPAVRELSLRPDASYLIIGGLRGLCGNLAIHMAKLGAKHIIVCSRSGISDEASQKVVMNCLANDCQVTEAKGDVSEEKFVREVFKNASPQIAGLIQGAMILRDKPYETMTVDEYHTAIFAKVKGTWALHNVSQEQEHPLDFFTMLSSISGIVGKKGQSNYSAANTFLDSFATYRQSLGLCANSVDLGLIEDVGYVAEQGGMDSHFDKRQWTPIMEGTLRKILNYSIFQQIAPLNKASSAQLVTGIGFPLPPDSDLVRDARFGYLFAQGAASSTAKEGNQGDQIIRAFIMMHKSGGEQSTLINLGVEILAAHFTKILRLEVEMEPGKSLMAYGLDSLAGVEMRNWIRMELGADLTTLEITNASSLIALSEKMVSKLPEVTA